MDSFYDIPRSAPRPTYVDQISATPSIPEVSLLCNVPVASTNSYASYNAWRNRQESPSVNIHPEIRFSNHNSPQNACQFSKKQVRFQSPMQQQRPSLTYEPFSTRKKDPTPLNLNLLKPSKVHDIESKPVLTNNTFEQIYMANVPNLQLDLSIIDAPPRPIKDNTTKTCDRACLESLTSKGTDCSEDNKENKMHETYKDFLETKKTKLKMAKPDLNDSVTDIFNYKRNCATSDNTCKFTRTMPQFRPMNISNKPIRNEGCGSDVPHSEMMTISNPGSVLRNHNYDMQKQNKFCEGSTQTSLISTSTKPTKETTVQLLDNDDSEPSTKDLLKIIAKQNEQLMLLQRQVATLLNRDQNQNKQIEDIQRINYMGEKCVTSTQNEHFSSPRKRAGLSKFSIDLMTSFEVAIRPQPKSNFVNCEPKIQEITESESLSSNKYSDKQVDQSLQLKEPVRIQESCPSPEPSININMNDYDSSDEEVSASEIGATFYNNLMGQVNDILKKAQMQTKEGLMFKQENKSGPNPDKKIRTLSKVKEATLKHLKSIGVTGAIDETNSSMSSDDGKKFSPTEISFAVKQLLMKYLPDDELAKIQTNPVKPASGGKDRGFISPRPEFSIASVQYMKKYNLIPSNEVKGTTNRVHKANQRFQQAQVDNPKILDMTALKMQPKLL